MSAESICGFVRAELPTLAAAVPTIWQAILQYGQATDSDLSSLRLGMSGGAAIPRSLVQAFEKQYGLRIIQGWG
jgi:fatty-acyl-CoA synthase